MTSELTYALITPARDEADHLGQLAACVLEQTAQPIEWIIVDDGSSDGTAAVAETLARNHDWIKCMPSPRAADANGSLELGRREGRDVISLKAGLAALEGQPDVLVKLDADVAFAPDFFERLLRRFEDNSQLGIASGTCYELEHGEWRQRHVTGDHVWGATRAYRRQCFEQVSPIEERLGWDGIDQLKANAYGWATETLLDLPFRHHRREGAREGSSFEAWRVRGRAAHFMGYRFWFLVLRSLLHARRDIGAVGLVVGWSESALRREPQCSDAAARARLRQHQSLRAVPARALEALGYRGRALRGSGTS